MRRARAAANTRLRVAFDTSRKVKRRLSCLVTKIGLRVDAVCPCYRKRPPARKHRPCAHPHPGSTFGRGGVLLVLPNQGPHGLIRLFQPLGPMPGSCSFADGVGQGDLHIGRQRGE